MIVRLPHPLELARRIGAKVFDSPYSGNLIVIRGPGSPDMWDGLLTLSFKTREDGWITRSWPAATRPGTPFLTDPINPRGTGMMAAGVQNRGSHSRGSHKGRPALVQVGKMVVQRDNDKDMILEPGAPEVNEGGGFNIHDIARPSDLAGCCGLARIHMTEFLTVVESLEPHQGKVFSLSVVEG